MPKNPADVYESTHWGAPATKIFQVDDPDLPAKLVQMGRLTGLKVKARDGTFDIRFPRSSHLAFDPGKARRLYLIVSRTTAVGLKGALWRRDASTYALATVAHEQSGRQSRFPYADVIVQCVGEATHILYKTKKIGDDAELTGSGSIQGPGSEYIHRFSEDSHGPLPIVCVDRVGRIWLAAGNYTVVDDGIAD